MSIAISLKRQENIENLKKAVDSSFENNNVSDLVILKFPRWSVYFKDGSSSHSFDFNAIDAGIVHKYLRINYIENQ